MWLDNLSELLDNKELKTELLHEQLFAFKASSTPSASLKNGKLTLGSYKFWIIKGTYEWELFEFSPYNLGVANVSLGVSDGIAEVSAIASIWEPSATLKINDDLSCSATAYIGSVGFKFKFGEDGFEVGGAWGIGFNISVKW